MKLLFTQAQIADIVYGVATDIRERSTKPILLLPVMSGAMVFCADLLRLLPDSTTVEPIIPNKHMPVIPDGVEPWIVDDVIASGKTLQAIKEAIPVKVYSVVLWATRTHRVCEPSLIGRELRERYVIGYGTDSAGKARGGCNLMGGGE